VALATGLRLGPYEILSPLGAGGMGEVYVARDTRLERRVAIKVLAAELTTDSAHVARFQREAKAASALNNPNIVTVYDVGETDSIAWVAMELVEGKSLAELIASGPLPTRKLLDLGGQIADGLAAAHDAGIVHRDLKPANVMVTREGFVKIVDFGLARALQRDSSGTQATTASVPATLTGGIVGTAGYMSPEQARGEPVDFHSDQFSFGSVLYEMATGQRAFRGDSRIDTLSAVLHDDPEPIARLRPGVPPPLRWVIERSKGGGQANETPIGYVPQAASLIGEGLDVSKSDVDQLLSVDRQAWKNNLKSQSDFFDTFGDHLPKALREEHHSLANRLKG